MKIKLPYPSKILGVTFTKGRTIGFEFTNLAMFNFRENIGVKDSKQLNDWTERHGQDSMINEIVFGAAQAYCMIHKVKENFDKEGLMKAITLSSDNDKKLITKSFNDAMEITGRVKDVKKKTRS